MVRLYVSLLEDSAKQLHIILERGANEPQMHKVKIIGMDPVVFDIIDQEFHVGWDPDRLDGRQINANNLGTG